MEFMLYCVLDLDILNFMRHKSNSSIPSGSGVSEWLNVRCRYILNADMLLWSTGGKAGLGITRTNHRAALARVQQL